jgi:hypothetical protein
MLYRRERLSRCKKPGFVQRTELTDFLENGVPAKIFASLWEAA